MTKFFTTITMIFVTIGLIIWAFIFVLGGAELLWWIFTGDFFHFVSESVEVASTVWQRKKLKGVYYVYACC